MRRFFAGFLCLFPTLAHADDLIMHTDAIKSVNECQSVYAQVASAAFTSSAFLALSPAASPSTVASFDAIGSRAIVMFNTGERISDAIIQSAKNAGLNTIEVANIGQRTFAQTTQSLEETKFAMTTNSEASKIFLVGLISRTKECDREYMRFKQ